MRGRLRGGRAGLALVMVLLAMALLSVVAAALVLLGSRTLWLSRASEDDEQAALAAEAGLDLTLDRLRQNADFLGLHGPNNRLEKTGATYESWVTGPGQTSRNGVAVPEGLNYVYAVGRFRGREQAVGMMIRIFSSDFSDAAFAAEEIDIRSNCQVDYWNSKQGDYDANKFRDRKKKNGGPDPKAHIATNSKKNEAIKLTGGSDVWGDASTGPGSGPNAVQLGQDSQIHGKIKRLNKKRELDPVELPFEPTTEGNDWGSDQSIGPGAYGDIKVHGQGTTLRLTQPGTYVFSSLALTNGSRLEIPQNLSEPIDIYVKQGSGPDNRSLNMKDGSVVNTTKKPGLLRFWVQGGKVHLDDHETNAYFVVYAPTVRVEVEQQAQIFGAVVGEHVVLHEESKLTYDLALKDLKGTFLHIDRISRQEF